MNILKKIIIIVTLIFFYACSKEKPKNNNLVDNGIQVKLSIDLPNIIKKGDTINGIVTYRSDFDTIKLKETERRYIFAILGKKNEIAKDTFALINDSIIPIYDIITDKLGNIFLDGYILDEVYLEFESKKGMIKKRTVKTNFSHTVTVEEPTID